MVAGLKERGELADPRLEEAFLNVPRHIFLPEIPLEKAYTDDAITVKHDESGNAISSSSQPTMMALMLRQLRLEENQNVLEVGAGTGYNAAIMQYLVGPNGNVTTLEIDKELTRQVRNNIQQIGSGNIRVVHADGAMGYAPRAAYDRIIATAGVWDIPKAWFDQLKPRGIVVAPIWVDAMQYSAAFMEQGDGTFYSGRNLPCGFILMRGTDAGPRLGLRVGTSPLVLMANDVQEMDGGALHTLLSDDGEYNRLKQRLESNEYFSSVLPYLALNMPETFHFAAYSLPPNQQIYGLNSNGFAVVGLASACFAPFNGVGETITYGAPDAFMMLQGLMDDWEAAGKPSSSMLRLRLVPKDMDPPAINIGRLYEREHHYLHVWQAQ